MTSLALFIAQQVQKQFDVRTYRNKLPNGVGERHDASDNEIEAVIASAIAEHEKAGSVVTACHHCKKPDWEHIQGGYCANQDPANWLNHRRFTPADPTKEKP